MSKIKVELKNDFLIIKKETLRKCNDNIENIPIKLLNYNHEYISKIKIRNEEDKNKILFITEFALNNFSKEDDEDDDNEIENKNVIIVYSVNDKIKYSYCGIEQAYKNLLKLKFKVVGVKLNKKQLQIKVLAYLINKYNLNISESSFFIDEKLSRKCDLKQYETRISKFKLLNKKHFYNFKFDIKDIINDDSIINGAIKFNINVDGNDIGYRIGIKNKKISHKKLKKKYYNLPMKYKYIGDYSIHIRRTIGSNLVLVKRLKEPIENTFRFKILENKFVSCILYDTGKIFTKLRKHHINLFYEKFASKAEEGVYELYSMCKKSTSTKNYFIIDKNSEDYEKIKNDKNVVTKFSLKYYWLIYNCKYFIASEAPSHLNVLRSNNKYLRKATYDKDFIFLQHGIIYMKNLGLNSSFSKGKDAECAYMVVSSEREKEVVSDMLGYDEDKLLKTGLGMFSKIQHNHISNNSDDIVTIMLTWKPYEEQLYNFEESSYYKSVIEIYNTLKKYIDENKIIIIGHPKANELLMNTDLKSSLWDKPISEALEKTKLLITDYSSVCYNSFYQGAGVIFYQPDLELYEKENGKLIPYDDEYIGKRAFSLSELEHILDKTITNKKINLNKVRAKQFEENYKTINEFSDGKNIERIYKKLIELNMI